VEEAVLDVVLERVFVAVWVKEGVFEGDPVFEIVEEGLLVEVSVFVIVCEGVETELGVTVGVT